jgi:hypothetical protein
MRLPGFMRRRPGARPDIRADLDRDVKGRPEIYIDGTVIPDRRGDRRPPPVSPGRRAEDPLDDPLPVPFVPRPPDPAENGHHPAAHGNEAATPAEAGADKEPDEP